MPLAVGDTTPTAYYVGDTEVTKIYLGDTEIYTATQPPPTASLLVVAFLTTSTVVRIQFSAALEETHLPPTSAFSAQIGLSGESVTQAVFGTYNGVRHLFTSISEATNAGEAWRITYTPPTNVNQRLQTADGVEVEAFTLMGTR